MILRSLITLSVFFTSFVAITTVADNSNLQLPPFPGSTVNNALTINSQSSGSNVSRYRLVLSELDNKQGQVFGERECRLSGDLNRRVDELPAGLPLEEVLTHYLNQVDGERLLYLCRGIDCGSSHFWANDVFGISRLVSREKDQAYFASLSAKNGKNVVKIVYISLRGGREPKALIDTLTTTDAVMAQTATMSDVSAALAHTSGWLPGLVVNAGHVDIDSSQPLITVINQLSAGVKSRLQLIMHCYDGVHIDDTLACSNTLASELQSALPGLEVRAQGALTPSPDSAATPAVRFVIWPGR